MLASQDRREIRDQAQDIILAIHYSRGDRVTYPGRWGRLLALVREVLDPGVRLRGPRTVELHVHPGSTSRVPTLFARRLNHRLIASTSGE